MTKPMTLTDLEIDLLKRLPKAVVDQNVDWVQKHGHSQKTYPITDSSNSNYEFKIFLRRSNDPRFRNNFSAGLIWINDSQEVILVRYNGNTHGHLNKIEETKIPLGNFHIHLATQRYQQANYSIDGFAEPTERYDNLNGAIQCLISDWYIAGLNIIADQINLDN